MTLSDNIGDAVRLAFWRHPLSQTSKASIGETILVFVVIAFENLSVQFARSSGWSSFSPYGLNSIVASTAFMAVTVLLFSRVDATPVLRRALLLFILAMSTVGCVTSQLVLSIAPAIVSHQQKVGAGSAVVLSILFIGWVIWWIGAARQAFRSSSSVPHPTWRAVAFLFCLYGLQASLPLWPAFEPKTFDESKANLWEILPRLASGFDETASRERALADWKEAQRKSVAVETQQPMRLEAALAAVAPRVPEKSNIFVVGVSGDSEEDVFLHETEQSLSILKSKFVTGDRVLALVNAEETTNRYPLASIENLGFVLREIGKRMDREKDVLVLTMTSHGSTDGLALIFGQDIRRALAPETLKSLLDEAGIKNRVLIVSACHAGVFVPVLSNPDTMILTAASATRTSFGCGSKRDWTYFGDALFARGLKTEPTLSAAFAAARKTIGQWEIRDGLPASDPQIFVGDAIARRFPQLVGTPHPDTMRADNTTEGIGGMANASN